MKVKLILLVDNSTMSRFMQCADVFEPWKFIGQQFDVLITMKNGARPSRQWLEKLAVAMNDVYSDRVLLAYLELEPEINWANPKCRAISTGKQWFAICQFQQWAEKTQA